MRILLLLLSIFLFGPVINSSAAGKNENFSPANEIQFKGKVLDYKGMPVKTGTVTVLHYRYRAQHGKAGNGLIVNGEFDLKLTDEGPYWIFINAPQHSDTRLWVPNLGDKIISATIRLGTYNYSAKPEQPRVIGDFNNFSPRGGIEMQPDKSGKWTAEIESSKPEILYQVVVEPTGLMGITIAGTGNSFEPHPQGNIFTDGFVSRAKVVNGKATIIFDPAALPAPGLQPVIEFGNPVYKEINDIVKHAYERETGLSRQMVAYFQASQGKGSFSLDSVVQSHEKKVMAAKGVAQHAELLSYLCLYESLTKVKSRGQNNSSQFIKGGLNIDIVKSTFQKIPVESPLWPIFVPAYAALLNTMPQEFSKNKNYFDAILEKNQNTDAKAELLKDLVFFCKNNGYENDFLFYRSMLLSDYSSTFPAKEISAAFSENRLTKNSPVPDFTFTSIDDKNKKLTPSGLKGKYYLVDFWATWCKGCIQDLPGIQKAYEKFNKKGFEVISVSFDSDETDVKRFREKRMPMPWFNTHIKNGFSSQTASDFGVLGAIPRSFLISPEGKIIAADEELRGDGLMKTLDKLIQ